MKYALLRNRSLGSGLRIAEKNDRYLQVPLFKIAVAVGRCAISVYGARFRLNRLWDEIAFLLRNIPLKD